MVSPAALMVKPRRTERRTAVAGFRPDIQALRALAVSIVVVYHFWPRVLPGGFVGVDVFFVISGFLITAHLVSEIRRSGRVSLPSFWARRARRLLPASLFVLAVTAVASFMLIPAGQRQQVFKEIVASAVYLQNWLLASDSVDYLAADNLPTPVQHFWSLSAEEQFYVVVPVLIAIALLTFRRRSAAGRDRVVAGALAVIAVASFGYSLYATFAQPGPAYFITPTRAWEFACGGLLAFVAVAGIPAAIRAAIAWAGWLGVAVSAFAITGGMPFPGVVALAPVLGTAAVIVGGGSKVQWAPERFLAIRPTVWLGDVSYSIYLWHWPVLVLAGSVLGDDLRWWVKVVLIAAVLLIAGLTTRLIEDPVRRMPALVNRPPRITFIAAVLAMALVAVPAFVGWQGARQAAADEVAAAVALAERQTECFGANARLAGHECDEVEYPQLTPDPSAATDDRTAVYADGCHTGNSSDAVPACVFGDPNGHVRVALVGDSHALNWLPALDALGQARGWQVVLLTRAACPFNLAEQILDTADAIASCASWKQNVIAYLEASDAFDVVFTSHFSGAAIYGPDEEQGVHAAWAQFLDRGSRLVVLRDLPRATSGTTACLEQHQIDTEQCARPIEDALADDNYLRFARGVDGVDILDFTDVFCWDGTCKSAIGGVTVYRDSHHITQTFSITLAPILGVEADRLGLP
ncbi:MAG: acyltransferase family protein [Pseudolysinimonas sp.]